MNLMINIDTSLIVNLAYIGASILFIVGLKLLGSPDTARKGNLLSSSGMLLAVLVTLADQSIIDFTWIIVGIISGGIVGYLAATKVQMTSMPEMVAIFNGFGGIASLLVGSAEFVGTSEINSALFFAIYLTVLIGGMTFTGSLVAYAKLSEIIGGRPTLYKGQQIVNSLLLLVVAAAGLEMVIFQEIFTSYEILLIVCGLAMLLGILFVIPIGGADMPVVIALLNSFSGLAACAAGFVIVNNVLIVAGALVGASGLILTNIMCKAMNRTLLDVLFKSFGGSGEKASLTRTKIGSDADEVAMMIDGAQKVIIVPGYGMAVSQCQHQVKEFADLITEKFGTEVKYAIHPVAGRMPGHMNVLLAEASVPYEQLIEMDDVNPTMDAVDVAFVIGANDVTNPVAKINESPIYGMPIIEVHNARTVFVLKRSMASGFAGIQNPLFFKQNSRMLFGDAKETVSALVAEFT